MRAFRYFIQFAFLTTLSISSVQGQNCLGVTLKKGGGVEMDSYNAKGKKQGTIKYVYTDVRNENGMTVIDVEYENISAKGKTEFTNKYSIKCTGDEIIIDSESMISEEQYKSMESYEMKFSGNGIQIPNHLSVGQKLQDASLNGRGNISTVPVTTDITISNRHVEAKESVTVPYGKFDAFKIKSDFRMKTVSVIPITIEYQTVSYRIPGELWDLKSETFRKGKLVSYTELVKVY